MPDKVLNVFSQLRIWWSFLEESQEQIGESIGIAKACLMALEDTNHEQQAEADDDDINEMAEQVTNRLDEAAARLSGEIYHLHGVTVQQAQEIQRLHFEN